VQFKNDRIYFRNFGIIERIKIWLRSKMMEPRFFFVVIDTTDSTTVRSLPRGIMNTYIIKALDENHARQIILRTMNPQVANQIQHSLYVYDLDMLMYNIDIAWQTKRALPLYSFMPMNGGRPARNISLPRRPIDMTPNEVTDVSSMVEAPTAQEQQPQQPAKPLNESAQAQAPVQQTPPAQPRPVQRQPINPNDARAVRTAAFQQNDYTPQGQVDDTLTSEQAQIVSALGAHPTRHGADEGANPRVNAATGQNLNQTRAIGPEGPTNQLSAEQLELIQKVGAVTEDTQVVGGNSEASIYEEAAGDAAWVPEDDLSQIEGDVLTAEQIAQMQEEFKQTVAETGIEVEDSKPQAANPDVSLRMGESNIDAGIKLKSQEGEING
jgi:hypothetical protein